MIAEVPTPFWANVAWNGRDVMFNQDIRFAATSRGGVMITGPADQAEMLATEINYRSHRCPPRIVDGGDEPALRQMLLDEGASGLLLVRNVDRLSSQSQSGLLAWMDRGHRVICWSDAVPSELLIPQLFYRLNVIRIDLRQGN
jgi:hypothetical protein